MHYVYIVECNDQTYYTGYTNNVEHRIHLHNTGKGAKYTRCRGPVHLVYYEQFDNKSDALKREYAIKQLTRQQKKELIHNFHE
ncbi:GIY-YIG nuclease family protein [Floccifex sp.]|uniref:GIY-YIG nuclease family protein n=1 Tax=Floccifex sp. TaxID=2815810 RepID=UPI002A74A0B5|nr:GIY-YIG nuclease family protein [Floccifex sp.]MDD7281761.1 GIY-YIG nuclease family protein [Erysipelotrichaceae bacterium]MDY2958997.1 GIY-YIG nuclease family protein [Floccifex sp.]